MWQIVSGVIPVLLLIGVGHALFQKGWGDVAFWQKLARLNDLVFLPCLILFALGSSPLAVMDFWPIILAIVCSFLFLTACLVRLKSWRQVGDRAFSRLYVRFCAVNMPFLLGLSYLLWGEVGVSLMAMCLVFAQVTLAVLRLLILQTYGHEGLRRDGLPDGGSVAKVLLRNPVILAGALGLFVGAGTPGFPAFVDHFLSLLGHGVFAIGLLTFGAGLVWRKTWRFLPLFFKFATLKLVIFPVLIGVGCLAFGVEGITREVLVTFGAYPVLGGLINPQGAGHRKTFMRNELAVLTTLGATGVILLVLCLLRLV